MEILDLKTVKQSDGWKYLSEKCPKFDELATAFINEAKSYVNSTAFNGLGILNSNEGVAINYETYFYGSKKVVLSYNSKPINRDLDCQFKEFRKIEFSLDDNNNLVVNKSSGRLESKYGTAFDESKDGVLKTSYSYQEFTPEGIELLYRGYEDKFILDKKGFSKCRNLRACVCGGYNPHLEEFTGKKVKTGLYGKNPNFVEKKRTVDNKGLVKLTTSTFSEEGKVKYASEEYCFNTFYGLKDTVNPFLIHIHRGIPPIAIVRNGEIVVNYKKLGVTKDNFKEVARTRFGTEIHDRRKELMDTEKIISNGDKKQLSYIKDLIKKYDFIYEDDKLDRWVWKETSSERSTRK